MTITPILAVILLSLVAFSKSIPSSPLLNAALISENCKTYWWSALLHIQNYVNPLNMVTNSIKR